MAAEKSRSKPHRHRRASLDELLTDKVKPQQPFSGVLISFQQRQGWTRELSDQTVVYASTMLFAVLIFWILSVVNPLGLMGKALPPELAPMIFSRGEANFPVLDFSVPAEGLVVLEPTYIVSGKLTRGEAFLIDGQAIDIDEGGAFSQAIPLVPDENSIHFTIIDGDKRISSMREVTYLVGQSYPQRKGNIETQLEGLVAANAEAVAEDLMLSVTVFPETTILTLTLDKRPQTPITLSAGGSYTWSAKESIVITTNKASSTVLYLNNKAIGVMGDKPTEKTRAFTWGDVR